jgi:amidase
VPLGPSPALKPKDLRIAVVESNPLVKVSADTAAVLQATVRLLAKAGAKVRRGEPAGLDWRQGWDDWSARLRSTSVRRCTQNAIK